MLLITVALLASPAQAEAYLDPGTGGMLLQLLVAGVGGVLVVLKMYWRRIVRTLRSRRRPDRTPGEIGPGA